MGNDQHFVFPAVICTGGLSSTCGAILNMAHHHRFTEMAFLDGAGCLDAPDSLPGGGVVNHSKGPAQLWILRNPGEL